VADPLRASLCPGVDGAALLNRHVFFVDFGRHAARPLPATGGVLHITVIRRPIERCLSRFYYERDSRGLFPPGTTIDECIDRKHPACRFDTFSAGDSVASGKGWSRERQLREECGSNYLTRCELSVTHSSQRHRRDLCVHTGGSAATAPTAMRRTEL
jgi:hypothetical protein